MYIDLPILSRAQCKQLLVNVTNLPPGMFCAGYIEGQRDACQVTVQKLFCAITLTRATEETLNKAERSVAQSTGRKHSNDDSLECLFSRIEKWIDVAHDRYSYFERSITLIV